jgi:hypothetical protein
MIIVAVFAGQFAMYAAAERRKVIAALTADLERAKDQVDWAERMNRRGYVSKAQLAAEKETRDRVRAQLEHLGALLADP